MKNIPLTKGYFALVDDEDYDFLNQWKWHVSIGTRRETYAKRVEIIDGKRIKITMHRMILCVPEGKQTDHIDHNGLNNQKSNLRTATPVQNGANRKMCQRNTSGFKGVSWSKSHNKWRAQISIERRNNHLGLFENAQDAAKAYDEGAIRLNGEFASTNRSLGLIR